MSRRDEWRWTDDQGVQRLVRTEELRAAIATSVLPPDTLIWREGMKEWAPAFSVPEFATITLQDAPRADLHAGDRAAGGPMSPEKLIGQVVPLPDLPLAPRPIPGVRPFMKTLVGLAGDEQPAHDGPSAPIIVPSAGAVTDAGARAITQLPRFTPMPQGGTPPPIPRAPRMPSSAPPRSAAPAQGIVKMPPQPKVSASDIDAFWSESLSDADVIDAAPDAGSSIEIGNAGADADDRAPTQKMQAAARPAAQDGRVKSTDATKPDDVRPPAMSIAGGSTAQLPEKRSQSKPPPPLPAKRSGSKDAHAEGRRTVKFGSPSSGSGAIARSDPAPLPAVKTTSKAPPLPASRRSDRPPAMDQPPRDAAATKAEVKRAPEREAARTEAKASVAADKRAGTARMPAAKAEAAKTAAPFTADSTVKMAPLSGAAASAAVASTDAPALTAKSPSTTESASASASASADTSKASAGGERPSGDDVATASATKGATSVSSALKGAAGSAPPVSGNESSLTEFLASSLRTSAREAASTDGTSVAPTTSSSSPPSSGASSTSGRASRLSSFRPSSIPLKEPVLVPVQSLFGAGAALIIMVVSAFLFGRFSVARPENARRGVAVAVTQARGVSAPLKPCWVTRQPVTWAPSVSKSIPFEVESTAAGSLLVGYARGAEGDAVEDEAVGVEVNPATGEVQERFSKKLGAAIERVTPLPGDPPSFAPALAPAGNGAAMLTVPAKPPFLVSVGGGSIGVAERADATPAVLWSLDGDKAPEAAHVLVEPNNAGYGIAFRRNRAIWGGVLGPDRKPLGALVRVKGSGGGVGKPMLAHNGRELAVVFADQPREGASWQIRIGATKGQAFPATTRTIALPKGGPGGDAFAPALLGLPDGRWLLIWTEGAAGSRAVRAQTFGPDFTALGDPIALSPPYGNFGQGVLGYAGGYAAAAFLSKGKTDTYELWGAILSCG